jgi:hypothetical protein
MSLASAFAATQATAGSDQVAADAAKPPSFAGPNGTAEVTKTGNLRMTPGPGVGVFEIPPAAALAFAAWIVETFGD